MRYRPSAAPASRSASYCLGTMMFGAVGNPDHDDCARIIHTALDRGINFVDTADMYSAGESEEIVGKALGAAATTSCSRRRCHFPMGDGPNRAATPPLDHPGGRGQPAPARTDWIDLYQVHRPDPTTDIEETLGGPHDLVHQGKIRAFGCSTFPAEQIVEAHHVAERAGLLRFRTEQPPYSMLARGDRDLGSAGLRALRDGRADLEPARVRVPERALPQGPARRDPMNGRAALQPDRFDLSRPENAAKLDAAERLAELADGRGCTLPELARRVHDRPPRRDVRDHRPPHPRPAREPARRARPSRSTTRRSTGSTRSSRRARTSPVDGTWRSPALGDPALRRRPVADRVAALAASARGTERSGLAHDLVELRDECSDAPRDVIPGCADLLDGTPLRVG